MTKTDVSKHQNYCRWGDL